MSSNYTGLWFLRLMFA